MQYVEIYIEICITNLTNSDLGSGGYVQHDARFLLTSYYTLETNKTVRVRVGMWGVHKHL